MAERGIGRLTAQIPSRDPDIPPWSRAGVVRPSSAQAPQPRQWRLKVPRAPGPDPHHLYGAQGNLQWQVSPYPCSSTRGHPLFCACLLQKTKVSQVSVMGADGSISTPWITEPLPWTLQYTPFSHSFLTPLKCPTPIIGKDLLSKFKASVIISSPPSDLAWLLHFNMHHLWCSSITTGSFLFFQTKLYEQFLPLTRNYTTTPL